AGRFLGAQPVASDRAKRGWGLGWLRGGLGGPGLGKVTRVGLRWGLRVPLVLALLAVLPALWGFGVSGSLGRSFFPPTDRDMFDLQVWMPASSSLERTEAEVAAIHAELMATPGVEKVDWLVGGAFPTVYYNLIMNMEETPFYARASVKTSSIADTERLVPAVQRALDEKFPAAQVVVKEFGQGPPVVADVEYRITGPDPAVLQRLGEEVRKRLQEHPEVLHTKMSMPRGEPKLWLAASEDAARQVGLTLRGLAEQTQAKLDGVTGGSVNEGLEQLPVRVRLEEGVRRDPSAIASLRYVNDAGDAVPVSALGGLELRPELGGISRYNGVRSNIVSAYTVVGSLPIDISAAVLEELTDGDGVGDLEVPAGYAIGVGGASEQDADAIGNLLIFVPILVTIMVAALILTFRSLRLAGLLGVVAVMSVGFALLATWMADFPVSFNMILGTLGLIGLALNDTIVVVAAIRADTEARAGNKDAVVRATLSCGRHVVSTTLTTIGGFMPLLLLSEGDFWPQLAIVLAGGVGGATLLAMGLIPAVYVMLFRDSRGVASDGATRV
ncbi:MAG: efflux RND transporter permease subunit, partial [Planctomycetota bacterium]